MNLSSEVVERPPLLRSLAQQLRDVANLSPQGGEASITREGGPVQKGPTPYYVPAVPQLLEHLDPNWGTNFWRR